MIGCRLWGHDNWSGNSSSLKLINHRTFNTSFSLANTGHSTEESRMAQYCHCEKHNHVHSLTGRSRLPLKDHSGLLQFGSQFCGFDHHFKWHFTRQNKIWDHDDIATTKPSVARNSSSQTIRQGVNKPTVYISYNLSLHRKTVYTQLR